MNSDDLIRSALDDAAEHRTERARAGGCTACAEATTQHCPEHQADLDLADAYRREATQRSADFEAAS